MKYPLYAEKVRFGYSEAEILKGLNLTVKTSQIIAIIGQSGSGKTTFLNLVSGVLTRRHLGKIRILGFSRALAKEDIGYVPQDIALVPDMNLAENIEFYGSINGMKREESIKAGKELMETLQLDVPMERRPTELSGGQRVRLNIVCSILHDPKVIILDEPFVGLDYANRKLLWHFLEHQKNRHKTVILTSHLLTEAEHHASRLVLLHKGKIFAKGKMEDIRHKLKTHFIAELKFTALSKTALASIQHYCSGHEVKILDTFNNYMMVSVKNDGQKNHFYRHLNSLRLHYQEIGYRVPNLDELFLRVKT